MINPVEIAVAPLKADAVKAAADEAKKTIGRVAKILQDADYDFNRAAPYPNSWKMSRKEYLAQKASRNLISSLVDLESTGINEWRAELSAAKLEHFVEQAEYDAAVAYNLYVAKLVSKIGPCETATLTGNHIWHTSILTVTFADKAPERWKTQTITNISKLGKVFLQWPTRKVK